ncbi:uncharacterized protein N7515_000495 [Penicillium bovifimosum]|uniref:Uncharacterized protein n=1 Tax=Penicillium bovifimosum TaxID=126998 RepID=A0A9W9LBH6_9EURO|nr:uncharacterized protein N7515_000495 [Penicillium bovifimosum]KAJ5145931.1 hypothetical protein N7515_000495 [Penicillium bovifimosum]
MVTTTIDRNPLDPNFAERRSSLTNMDQSNPPSRGKGVDGIADRDVAPSPHAMCSELAHQHAIEGLHQNTEHWTQKEVDHRDFLADLSSDRGLQAHPEEIGE